MTTLFVVRKNEHTELKCKSKTEAMKEAVKIRGETIAWEQQDEWIEGMTSAERAVLDETGEYPRLYFQIVAE